MIHRSGLTSRFISLFYAELESAGNLTYVNGGHCPPLLVTPGKKVYELKVSGPVLGPLPDASYTRGYLTMKPSEVLVVFSDGVTERHEPNDALNDPDSEVIPVEFGREGLIETITENLDKSADEIVQAIMTAVKKFGLNRPFEDDVSVMVIKRLPAGSYPPEESLTLLPTETRR